MLALGPVFIIFGLFDGTRGLFEGWLKAAVLFALTPLLAVLIGGGTIALLSPMLDSLAAAGSQVPLRLTTTLFLASAVYCALMIVTLKIAGTMVAGWRLPFGNRREQSTSIATTGAQPELHPAPLALEGPTSRGTSRDPRVSAIVSAAASGTAMVADRSPAPTYPLYGPAPSGTEALASPAVAPRSDPRLGSLSRHYRPRLQPQRTSS
jgi:type IV secretion system protein VirB6